MSSGFAQVQVSFHYQGKQLCGFEKGIFVVVVVMLFFFFLSVLYVKQITSDAVYMFQFSIEKYLKRAISVDMLQRTMKHDRLRSYDEILCPIYTFTCLSGHT